LKRTLIQQTPNKTFKHDDVRMIFGAPGCGKTTTLLDILEKELERVDPDKIAYVSFTRKGTYEGRDRALEKFGYSGDDLPFFRTLHSLAFRAGGYKKHDMISRADYKEFSKAMDMKFTGYYTEEFYHNDDLYLFLQFLMRNNPEAADPYFDSIQLKIYEAVCRNYDAYKKHAKVIDFTDIIEQFIRSDYSLPVKVAIIDEAQDLTSLQWLMCLVAFKDCERVYIAGDDDQAIYEWNGADVRQFLGIRPRDVKILDKSYRLHSKILTLAQGITANIGRRVEKRFDPVDIGGEISFYNRVSEVPIVEGESYYFLSRNNWFLGWVRDRLRRESRTYWDKGNFSVDKRIVAAINAWEAARKGDRSDETRIKYQRFMLDDHIKEGPGGPPWFEALDLGKEEELPYYRDLIRNKTDLSQSDIQVNTIHGVKGGEADNVVLLLDYTRAVRASFERNPDSELRCLYVACTRARKHLHLVYKSSSNGYDDFVYNMLRR
jgi:superfamily I DNA/RNA helicase